LNFPWLCASSTPMILEVFHYIRPPQLLLVTLTPHPNQKRLAFLLLVLFSSPHFLHSFLVAPPPTIKQWSSYTHTYVYVVSYFFSLSHCLLCPFSLKRGLPVLFLNSLSSPLLVCLHRVFEVFVFGALMSFYWPPINLPCLTCFQLTSRSPIGAFPLFTNPSRLLPSLLLLYAYCLLLTGQKRFVFTFQLLLRYLLPFLNLGA